MIRSIAIVLSVLASGCVGSACLAGGQPWLAIIAFAIAIIWVFGHLKRWGWVHSPAVLCIFILLSLGLFLKLSTGLLFTSGFLALIGWDLSDFSSRLELSKGEEHAQNLIKDHFLHLGINVIAGVGLVLLALNLHLRLTLGALIGLSILSVWGLGRLVFRLLKKE